MKKIYGLPRCYEDGCFACEKGHCTVLTNNNFGKRPCPFFKTMKQVKKEKDYCKERLEDIAILAKERI